MRQTVEMDRVQQLMQPGELTLDGFLGEDRRKLVDIIAADNEVVRTLQVTHAQIADRFAALTAAGKDLMEGQVEVEGRYILHVRDDRGVMPSPWGDGNFGKGDVQLTDKETGAHFRWNELVLHMIRAYGFYGGKNASYRIDPTRAVKVLEITPENDAHYGDLPTT